MRRWMFMAALMAVLALPLWGQRGGHGGGMAMRGTRGGMVAHGGFGGAPHGGSWGGGFHGHPFYSGHYPYYGWRYGRGRGYGYWGYPWWGWYGGVGWGWWPDDSSSYSQPSSYPVYAYGPSDNSAGYDQQQEIDRLNDEVARLRAEQNRYPSRGLNGAPEASAEIHSKTVFVFRDHHSEEVQNYAIVGKTLWVFSEQRARKIPVAELDVPATTRANDARGIDFRLPGQ